MYNKDIVPLNKQIRISYFIHCIRFKLCYDLFQIYFRTNKLKSLKEKYEYTMGPFKVRKMNKHQQKNGNKNTAHKTPHKKLKL